MAAEAKESTIDAQLPKTEAEWCDLLSPKAFASLRLRRVDDPEPLIKDVSPSRVLFPAEATITSFGTVVGRKGNWIKGYKKQKISFDELLYCGGCGLAVCGNGDRIHTPSTCYPTFVCSVGSKGVSHVEIGEFTTESGTQINGIFCVRCKSFLGRQIFDAPNAAEFPEQLLFNPSSLQLRPRLISVQTEEGLPMFVLYTESIGPLSRYAGLEAFTRFSIHVLRNRDVPVPAWRITNAPPGYVVPSMLCVKDPAAANPSPEIQWPPVELVVYAKNFSPAIAELAAQFVSTAISEIPLTEKPQETA